MSDGITLRHLCFTGPTKPPATLEFVPGLNVVYGASETGKSFILEAIDFMLGAKGPLRDIPERVGYDRIWLGIHAGEEPFTLVRSISGGNFELYNGLVRAPQEAPGVILAAKHSGSNDDNLSAFILKKVGLANKRIRKNAEGDTISLSFRSVAHLCIVNETDIQKQTSPVETGEAVTKTPEWSTFKLMLTGVDDSALVTSAKDPAEAQSRGGKLEVLDELISEYKRRLGEQIDDTTELRDQYERLQAAINEAQHAMRATEAEYQVLSAKRAQVRTKVEVGTDRQAELKDLFSRFRLLESHYSSDLDRLQAMREAGSVIAALSPVSCPLCGASPAQQHLQSDCAGNLDKVVSAVDAESAKIQRLRKELEGTVDQLHREESSLSRLVPRLRAELANIEGQVREITPTVQRTRASYSDLVDKRASVLSALTLANEVAELQQRRVTIEIAGKSLPAVDSQTDMSVSTADLFAKSVEALLKAWDFPGAERVFFDLSARDLIISGKPRGSRGKGLRAITHAAFTIGLAEFCRNEGRAHPGFVLLDSPLLAYREPEVVDGDEDLTGTDLQNRFYQYLAKWSALQAIIIENTSPPDGVAAEPLAAFFSKNPRQGRYGLFPIVEHT
jgi:predicted nuclease with TOPRIM domain